MKKLYNFFRKIDKRQRFIASIGLILVFNIIITQFSFTHATLVLPLYALILYGASYFFLLEEISQIEWIALFILPVTYGISLLLFYYLLPVFWLTRIPYLIVLAIGMYAIILCENIFNVGVEKSLPLYRAAFSVANFMILVVCFLLYTVLYSFHLHFLVNTFIGGVLAWPLFFHGIWIANPKEVLEERVYKYATILTVLFSFGILIMNFIPIKTNIFAFYTVAIIYLLLGTTQEIIQDTAFRERIRIYLIVFVLMTILMLLSASWG